MPEQGSAPSEPQFFEVRVKVWCTDEQVVHLSNQIGHLLCPDLEHDGPCEIPWEISTDELALDDVPPDLIAEIENFHTDVDLNTSKNERS